MVQLFSFYFLLKCNISTTGETMACQLSIQSRTRCLVLTIHDPPVQINNWPETVGIVCIFLIAVIPFPIGHLLEFHAVAFTTLNATSSFYRYSLYL
jgi:hypothetical protein